MHAREKTNYARSVGIRLTTDQLEAVRAAASRAGMKPGIYLRGIINKAVTEGFGTEVMAKTQLAELLAFREITLNLLFDLSKRMKDDLETMVMKVDSKKRTLADKVIEEAKQ